MAMAANSYGQEYRPGYLLQPNEFFDTQFEVLDSSGWFQALPETEISFTNFWADNKHYFGMGADDSFVVTRETNDDYPFMNEDNRMTHTRYNQTYQGVKVEFAEIFLHHKDNKVEFINGKLAEGLNLSVTPAITEPSALTAAINHLGTANLYSWQDPDYEAAYKEEKGDTNATTYPVGELVIAKQDYTSNYDAEQFVLAWKFTIQSLSPEISVEVYINAENGTFLKEHNLVFEGTGTTLSYGYGSNVYLDTRWRGGLYNHHVLRSNDANAPKIWTKKHTTTGAFGGYDCVLSPPYCTPNAFDNDDIWHDETVTTPHWIGTHAWNYWKTKFNRNSYDNNYAEVKILNNMPTEQSSYNPNDHVLRFGRLNGNGAHHATRDIVGHEFAHAVIWHTAKLGGYNEPGALNESFADIFGYELERYIAGGHVNWLLGEDTEVRRVMNNPATSMVYDASKGCGDHNTSQPAFYHGARWYFGNCDRSGVHINGGVQNYWFYLLTMGSTNAPEGTYNNIAVSGIGADKARNIAFYNVDNFLGSNSQYLDAALGAMLSASVMFGTCSNESRQTRNAWAAVDSRIKPYKPLSIAGPNTIYLFNGNPIVAMPVNYLATGGNSRKLNWTCSSAWSWSNLSSNLLVDNIFSISNFNNNYVTTTITVADVCVTVPKTIYFKNLSIMPEFEDLFETAILINPNPSTAWVSIEVILPEAHPEDAINITVTDNMGTTWFNQTYSGGVLPSQFNFSSLPIGNYIVTATQSGQVVSTHLSRH